MKATVWTAWNGNIPPKCIFNGDIVSIPRVGEYVTVREGFGACTVQYVTHDFVTGEIEIGTTTKDYDNEYGEGIPT